MGNTEHNIDRATLEAVCFDVTGTLIHCPRAAAIYSEVLGRHGMVVPEEAIRQVIPRVWQEVSCQTDPRRDRFAQEPGGEKGWWHRFVERVCLHLEVGYPSRFASAEMFHRFARPEAWEIYSDTLPTLEALTEAGLRLGVVSNWDHRLPSLLTELGLSRFFDAVVYSASCGVEKPHPLIFELCLRELATSPQQAVHVGNHPLEDIEGAAAAGLWALQIDRQQDPQCLQRLLGYFLEPSKWMNETGRRKAGGRSK